jgi:hypothetical protein
VDLIFHGRAEANLVLRIVPTDDGRVELWCRELSAQPVILSSPCELGVHTLNLGEMMSFYARRIPVEMIREYGPEAR